MYRQVAGLFLGQKAVLLAHPRQTLVKRGIAARLAPRRLALVVDPRSHSFGNRCGLALRQQLGGKAKPLNVHKFPYLLGVKSCKSCGNNAAQRVRYDRYLFVAKCVD